MEIDANEIVLSPPYSVPGAEEGAKQQQQSQMSPLSIALEIIKGIKPGTDLASFQISDMFGSIDSRKVPPQMNIPKSGLQLTSEAIYCCGREDLLSHCTGGDSPAARFLRVLAWHFSTLRSMPFCQAPFNPVLGETHHVSSGSLNVMVEQVSHHPQITAMYATDEARGIRLLMGGQLVAHFRGNGAEASLPMAKTLWLDLHSERYDITCPMFMSRLFPSPGNSWTGGSSVKCKPSGLEATISFKSKSLFTFGRPGNVDGQVTGSVRDAFDAAGTVLYEISGLWNRKVMVKDVKAGETTVLYDAMSALAGLKPLTVRANRGKVILEESESVVVWKDAMQAVVRKDWAAAREAKQQVADRQRRLAKLRKQSGQIWEPRHFVRAPSEPGAFGWQWRGDQAQFVPPSPLVYLSSDHLNLERSSLC